MVKGCRPIPAIRPFDNVMHHQDPAPSGRSFFTGALHLAWGGRPFLALALFALVIAAAGCFSPRGSDGPQPPLGGPEYSALMVSSDLAKGSNRLVFALVSRDNVPVRAEQAQVVARYTPRGSADSVEKDTATATFLPWPPEGSNRGVFVAPKVQFEVSGDATDANPGLWELDITANAADGSMVETTTAVRVASAPSTPELGAPAPRSVTPTAHEVEDLSHITSALHPDPDLYRLSVHEALEGDKPLVVLFSTPAFCVSATCGPQLEILGQLKDRYLEQANFIHVEVFENPHLIEGNRTSARQVPAVEEWGLPTEPWTFVVDREGRVSDKFEQFIPEDVLEEALQKVL